MGREVGRRPAFGQRRPRIRASLKILVPTVAALGAGAAVAVGQIGGSDNTITGCVLTSQDSVGTPIGSLRVVDPSSTIDGDTSCDTSSEEQITWNQQGPQGATGPQGAPGTPGAPGAPGATGATGPAGTVQVSSGSGVDITMLLAPTNDLGKLTPVGESTIQNQATKTKSFDLSSFSLGATNSQVIGSATKGAGAGKVSFEKFQFVTPLDKYSAELFQDLASGSHLTSVEIVVRKPGPTGMEAPVVQYVLKTVFITDFHVSGDAGRATETIQGEFGAIQFVLYQQSNNGTTSVGSTGGWSQVTNSPVTIPGLGTIRDVHKVHRRK
jgi:type VI secretion system secreted protein Hcp